MTEQERKANLKQLVSGLLNVYPDVGAYTTDIKLKIEADRLMIKTSKHQMHLSFRSDYLVVTKNGRDTILNPLFANAANLLTADIIKLVNIMVT